MDLPSIDGSFEEDSLRSLGRAEARPYNPWETRGRIGPPSPGFLEVRILKVLSDRGSCKCGLQKGYGLTISAKTGRNTVFACKCAF